MGNITENFDRSEFACHCNCGFNQINIGLVHRLQAVRDIFNIPIIILSGCRCRNHNTTVGGEPDSYHMKGDAADWTTNNLSEIVEGLSHWSGGVHYYPEKNFIHCDVGLRRRWF